MLLKTNFIGRLCFLAGLLCSGVFAQQPGVSVVPAGIIDGSVTPELIPDIVAYRLFFSALAGRTKAGSSNVSPNSNSETPRQKAKLRSIGLNSADESALVAELAKFRADVDGMMAETKARVSMGVAPSSSTQSLNDIANNHVGILQSQMTTDGSARLLQYVRAEKSKMRMIPFPEMSGHSH
jgi:hypothetical protein